MDDPPPASNNNEKKKGAENSGKTGRTSSSSFQLTPSQALRPVKNDVSVANAENSGKASVKKNNNNNRRRRNTNKNQKKSPVTTDEGGDDVAVNDNAGNKNNNGKGNDNGNKGKKQRQRQRGKKKGGEAAHKNSDGKDNAANANNEESNNNKESQQTVNAKKRNRNKNRKAKKKYPWRRHIPEGTVDPITLEDLNTLEYPPFALVADQPYVPVPVWPVPIQKKQTSGQDDKSGKAEAGPTSSEKVEDVEDLNRQRLADQWGEFMLPSKETSTTSSVNDKEQVSSAPPSPPLSERPLNLFDGRALAFYMVSQLQFIDPFTRRDLTRPELLNLDRYLDRYGSGDTGFGNNNNQRSKNKKQQRQKIRVTDAYDAKGITLSSAGAAAATAQGRADIMQQMAQQLLNSLFVGQPSVSTIAAAPATNDSFGIGTTNQSTRQQEDSFSLQEQYAALQRQERAAAARGEQQYEQGGFTRNDLDVYNAGDFGFGGMNNGGGGYMIIDDDENPELRGRGHSDFPSLAASSPSFGNGPMPGGNGPSPFYSASHITGRHGGSNPAAGSGAFPSLPAPASASGNNSRDNTSSSTTNFAKSNNSDAGKSLTKNKKSKTLSRITRAVKKTTAEEKQRQWEAREAARRKAMMSNLTFGMNPVAADPLPSSHPAATPTPAGGSATEEQLVRNRAFAEALGVKPATQRHYASGWARPTEHLDELEAALYPDELILKARDHRMQLLLKIEKKWTTFLNDDKAASLPLNRMDRASRKFVHHYAEFWKLKTESFDPEPNRYIHCVKLLDTRMPRPLLSDVARNWRGPSSLPFPDATRTIASIMNDHTSQQTAGQTSSSSSTGLREQLKPPPKLRSATAISSSKGDLVAFGEAAVQNSRSDALRDKERPKMNLLPRSVPLELPPFEEQLKEQKENAFDIKEDIRKRQLLMEKKRQQEKQIEQRKQKALEDAFASDDEDEVGNLSDSDSEWGDKQEALFDGSDED